MLVVDTAVEELGIFGGVPNQLVLLRQRRGGVGQRQLRLARVEVENRLGEQLLSHCAHSFVGVDLTRERHRGRLLDDASRIARTQADDAPHALLRLAAALVEEFATEGVGVGADLRSTGQDLMGLS